MIPKDFPKEARMVNYTSVQPVLWESLKLAALFIIASN